MPVTINQSKTLSAITGARTNLVIDGSLVKLPAKDVVYYESEGVVEFFGIDLGDLVYGAATIQLTGQVNGGTFSVMTASSDNNIEFTPYASLNGVTITSPVKRYLRIKVVLRGSDATAQFVANAFTVSESDQFDLGSAYALSGSLQLRRFFPLTPVPDVNWTGSGQLIRFTVNKQMYNSITGFVVN